MLTAKSPMTKPHFLGVDLSTQSLTGLVVCPEDGAITRYIFNFDKDLPEYGTQGGVPPGQNAAEALVNPLMWVAAIDRMLGWCRAEGMAGNIAALSVSAQQHGTVYLNDVAASRLNELNPSRPLYDQLHGIFSRQTSPIWMDTSTRVECDEMTASLGRERIVALTGSPATERFAGPQIRKFWKQDPAAYEKTVHITLISAFITALFIGRLAPLDGGDGLGTNLVDIQTRTWSPAAMAAAAPNLATRLPAVLGQDKVVGKVSAYLCQRYGFKRECKVVVGTGDNPASLVGLGMVGDEDVRAISLGTSDTYFGYRATIPSHRRSAGHVFGTSDGGLMLLVCFKNGSLARDAVRRQFGIGWDRFSKILLTTPPGNDGKLMLPYFVSEMTPMVLEPGVRRFGGLKADDMAGNIRAVAEAQMMSIYLHSRWIGRRPQRLFITAGGSQNEGLLKLIAQVFGVPVQVFDVSDSAALGAAIRAAVLWHHGEAKPAEMVALSRNLAGGYHGAPILACDDDINVYQGDAGLLNVYEACERIDFGGFSAFKQRHRLFLEQYLSSRR